MDTDNQNITQDIREPFLKRNWWKLLISLILLLVVIGLIKGPPEKASPFSLSRGSDQELALESERFIQADFIDLDRISRISKFRSGAGHDFSSNGETCRSMKHYFTPFESETHRDKRGFPPKPDGQNDISIYSPVDGKVIAIESDQIDIGRQIYLQPKEAAKYTIRLFHVYPLEGIKKGSQVKAGQKIGVIGQYQETDIAIQQGRFRGQFFSYFDFIPDGIFAKYQERGVKARDDLIITKEARDANPLQCNGEQFRQNHDDGTDFTENFVPLSGYISPSR